MSLSIGDRIPADIRLTEVRGPETSVGGICRHSANRRQAFSLTHTHTCTRAHTPTHAHTHICNKQVREAANKLMSDTNLFKLHFTK